MPIHKGGKKGTKKYGRAKVKCARYRSEGRPEKNKTRRAATQKRRELKQRTKAERRRARLSEGRSLADKR